MNQQIREIIIGAATLALLIGGLVGMSARHQITDAGSDEDLVVYAKFNKVDGLVEGTEVRLGGIRVGYVSAMALDEYFRAVVAFTIEKSVPLPMDTSAAIHTDGLFGSKFVVLEPGAEEVLLESDGQLNFTQDAVVVGDLLDLIISEGYVARGQGAKPSQ